MRTTTPAFLMVVTWMQPAEYKAICQRPDVFQRLTLEETLNVLKAEEPELISTLKQEMNRPPMPKPTKHEGDWTTDFFCIRIGVAEAEAIRDACMWKEVEAVNAADGGTTAAASHYASLADRWTDYIVWLD